MSQVAKTLVSLVALLAVAGGLGLYAWKGVYAKDEREKKQKDRAERLFAPEQVGEKAPDGGAALALFTHLTVTAKGETTVLDRVDGGAWQLTAPLSAPADRFVLDGIVSQLQTAKFKTAVDPAPDPEALKSYGLSPPQFVVEATATVEGKERSATLKGGLENSYNGTIFMQRGADPTVWAAEGGVRFALDRSTYDLRDKEVLAFEEPKLKRVEVKTKSNAYVLERDEARAWRLKKPTEAPADATAITAAFGSLKAERALSFPVDSAQARTAAGLDAPQVDLNFTYDDGSTARLRLGRPDADRAKVTALREGAGAALLAEVPGNALAFFDRNPGDFNDKAAVHFVSEKVMKIAIKPEVGDELVLQRIIEVGGSGGGGSAWLVVAPKPGAAKAFKVTALLWVLSALKANGLGEQKPKDWGKYGLDPKSARRVTLYDAKGGVLSQLLLGREVPNKIATVYARGDRDQVLEVDSTRLGELPKSADDLLDAPAPAADAGSR